MEIDINTLKSKYKDKENIKEKKNIQQPKKKSGFAIGQSVRIPKFKRNRQLERDEKREFKKTAQCNITICNNLREQVRSILSIPAKDRERMSNCIKEDVFMNDFIDDKMKLKLISKLNDEYKFICLYGIYLFQSM